MSALPPLFLRQAALVTTLVLLSSASCNKPRQVEIGKRKQEKKTSPTAPAERTPALAESPRPVADDTEEDEAQPLAEPQADVTDREPPASEDDEKGREKEEVDQLKERLKKLKFRARRDVVWCRTTIANIPSYARALEKFEAEFAQWQMYRKVPMEPEFEAFEKELKEVLVNQGLEVLFLNVGPQKVSTREIPGIIHGDRAWSFEDNDIRGISAVTLKIARVDDPAVQRFKAALKEMDRLVLVRRVKPTQKDGLLFNLEIYHFLDIEYPIHVIEQKDLQREMHQSGIEVSIEEALQKDSIGYLQNASLSYKEFNSSQEKLNEAMQLLSRSKFLEARSTFFRGKMEEAGIAPPSQD